MIYVCLCVCKVLFRGGLLDLVVSRSNWDCCRILYAQWNTAFPPSFPRHHQDNLMMMIVTYYVASIRRGSHHGIEESSWILILTRMQYIDKVIGQYFFRIVNSSINDKPRSLTPWPRYVVVVWGGGWGGESVGWFFESLAFKPSTRVLGVFLNLINIV